MQAPQMSSYTGTMITTDLIQKYLDENKQLILAILDNQNLGKLHECAAYQSKLQQNLMYLAAIADAQPQAPVPATQMPGAMQAMPGSMMQANAAQYIQQQQHQMAAAPALMTQQQQQQPQQQPGNIHYMQNPLVHQTHQVQQQQHQQQRPLGMQMPSHGEVDLSGNVQTMGYADYGAATPATAAHPNSAANANAGSAEPRTGAAGLENGSNPTAQAAGAAPAAAAGSAAAVASGEGNVVGVNGDDAGSSFLKASEED